jgi:4-deoxy-L-threo-5-hexosulose-uronate ketol-isomerase
MLTDSLRCLPRAEEARLLDGEALRRAFLLEDLFAPGELRLIPTDADRLAAGAVVPDRSIALPPVREFGTAYFLERRELGVFNIGARGVVHVGGESFILERHECLYIGMGEAEVRFEPAGSPLPEFYLLSSPAHAKYPTRKATKAEAQAATIGDPLTASRRTIYRYIHAEGVRSCQLVMGMTELEPGSIWNTMPPHTHTRRSEIYLYDGLGSGALFHFLGEPEATRHIVVRDREAVVSPPWSIHMGAGTQSYRFIWGMAGENQTFEDMDAAPLNRLA